MTHLNSICQHCGIPFHATPSRLSRGGGRYCSIPCYVQAKHIPPETRFWSKVAQSPDAGACWLWTANHFIGGYGQFGRSIATHRYAWKLATGREIPKGAVIAHTCDVRACVRNDDVGTYVVEGVEYERHGHLFLASTLANARDAMQKGRYRHGEGHSEAKLTEANVRLIREQYARGGISHAKLARLFGVDPALISRVILRKSWRHI